MRLFFLGVRRGPETAEVVRLKCAIIGVFGRMLSAP